MVHRSSRHSCQLDKTRPITSRRLNIRSTKKFEAGDTWGKQCLVAYTIPRYLLFTHLTALVTSATNTCAKRASNPKLAVTEGFQRQCERQKATHLGTLNGRELRYSAVVAEKGFLSSTGVKRIRVYRLICPDDSCEDAFRMWSNFGLLQMITSAVLPAQKQS